MNGMLFKALLKNTKLTQLVIFKKRIVQIISFSNPWLHFIIEKNFLKYYHYLLRTFFPLFRHLSSPGLGAWLNSLKKTSSLKAT